VVSDLGLDYGAPAPFAPDLGLAAALLIPTRIYVRSCLAAIRAGGVHALAHITGGGLVENLPRVLPSHLAAEIDGGAWTPPPVFAWLTEAGDVPTSEMLRTFNCGIGMVAVVAADRAEAIAALLIEHGERVHRIGRIGRRAQGGPGVSLDPAAMRWRP